MFMIAYTVHLEETPVARPSRMRMGYLATGGVPSIVGGRNREGEALKLTRTEGEQITSVVNLRSPDAGNI